MNNQLPVKQHLTTEDLETLDWFSMEAESTHGSGIVKYRSEATGECRVLPASSCIEAELVGKRISKWRTQVLTYSVSEGVFQIVFLDIIQ